MRRTSIVRNVRVIRALKILAVLGASVGFLLLVDVVTGMAGIGETHSMRHESEVQRPESI